jgi:hypothetical protein
MHSSHVQLHFWCTATRLDVQLTCIAVQFLIGNEQWGCRATIYSQSTQSGYTSKNLGYSTNKLGKVPCLFRSPRDMSLGWNGQFLDFSWPLTGQSQPIHTRKSKHFWIWIHYFWMYKNRIPGFYLTLMETKLLTHAIRSAKLASTK